MRILFILFLCGALNCNAQNKDYNKAYNDFKNQVQKEYDDFRKQANEQYAVFMKQAWEQYRTLPAIPKPKDETIPPMIVPDENRNKPIENHPIPIKEIVTPPNPTPQPIPIAPLKNKYNHKKQMLTLTIVGQNALSE